MEKFHKKISVIKEQIKECPIVNMTTLCERNILRIYSNSKQSLFDFIEKVIDIKNKEYEIHYFSDKFWAQFLKIVEEIDTVPDKNEIVISISSLSKPMKKKTNKNDMQNITKKIMKELNLV